MGPGIVPGKVKEIFQAIEDPFLRERFLDLEQVAARLQRILSGVEDKPC